MSARVQTRRACMRYVSTLSVAAAWRVAAELLDEPALPAGIASLLVDLQRYTIAARAAVLDGSSDEKRDTRTRVRMVLTSLASDAAQWCMRPGETRAGELAEVSP